MMPKNNADRLAVLKQAMAHRRKEIEQKVTHALYQMQIAKAPINFQSVARQACVSKSWLYQHTDISLKIRQLRADNDLGSRSISPLAVHQQAMELKQLHQKVACLEKQVIDLNKQLEQAHAEIFKLRHKV